MVFFLPPIVASLIFAEVKDKAILTHRTPSAFLTGHPGPSKPVNLTLRAAFCTPLETMPSLQISFTFSFSFSDLESVT